MITDYYGVILAVVTFLAIGLGHVFVRKVNYAFGVKPAPLVFLAGIGLLYLSMFAGDLLSAVLGILGMTVIWDGIELYRQENRIRKGFAPENPKRPVKNEN
ncbi:MAG TPA: DUF4491 family protein [Calditrichaeota bacterium]|nr:DUF4491 family protein [Calditrichota bacterium]